MSRETSWRIYTGIATLVFALLGAMGVWYVLTHTENKLAEIFFPPVLLLGVVLFYILVPYTWGRFFHPKGQ